MLSFKGRHFEKEMILMAVRWYVAYALSYRDIEELMLERGLRVDHSTLNWWVVCYAPQLEDEFRKRHKQKAGLSWRADETYIKIKGEWHYLPVPCGYIVRWINQVIRLISCCQKNEMKLPPGLFLLNAR